MARYECLYSSGKQFVFVERQKWVLVGLAFVSFCGVVVGLLMGVTVSIADVANFELLFVAFVSFWCYRLYVHTFQGVSSTFDLIGFLVALLAIVAFVAVVLVFVRSSFLLDISASARCLLFSAAGVVLALTSHGYHFLVLREDERKHHLALCSSEGSDLFVRETSPARDAAEEDEDSNGWLTFGRFVVWILTWQWYHDTWECPEPDEEIVGNQIVVHNRSLKLVKVCLYSADDMFCGIPFGGVSGRYIGFINAEQKRTFTLPRKLGTHTPSFLRSLSLLARQRFLPDGFVGASDLSWTLKVFQPSLFDKELACIEARSGHSFAFYDVECMVKRSRVLSARTSPIPKQFNTEALTSESEFSEDELCCSKWKTGLLSVPSPPLSSDSDSVPRVRSGWKRNGSVGCLKSLQMPLFQQASPSATSPSSTTCASDESPGRLSLEQRRAGPDEVVFRNRSGSEVRASLFKATDYTYMVPLVGEVVVPNEECRFNDVGMPAQEFTLKVYSVGPASKELTYLTVERGQCYTFCDSLLS